MRFVTSLADSCTRTSAVAADWKPDKPIEFIVGTGPGSGVDNTARMAQAILQTQNWSSRRSTSSTSRAALTRSRSTICPVSGRRHPARAADVNAAHGPGDRAVRAQVFRVHADREPDHRADSFHGATESPIANSKDLAQRLKADPAAVSIALANARGNAFHITAALFARAAGADAKKLKIVVYTSSGDAVAALLGGHVDVVAVTPGNFLPLFEAKKIRILGLGSARRSGGLLATVPTFKEQGFDVVFDLPRSVMGAKGLTPEQIRFWDGVFGRMVKTDEWRQAIEKNQWEDDYLNSAELAKSLKAQNEILKDVLTEIGMAKQ